MDRPTPAPRPPSGTAPRPTAGNPRWLPWVDVAAIAAWGALMLKYWLSGRLYLLIHPAYRWLTIAAGFGLLFLAGFRAFTLLAAQRHSSISGPLSAQHVNNLPHGFSTGLLLIVAIAGFLIPPRAFTSEMAAQRGINDFATLTRVQPQAFRGAMRPEERGIIDWVRTLNVYPEPDAYSGQAVNLQGFVVYPPDLPTNYLWISRFVITCCAADVYPVGLPVKLQGDRTQYPKDTWLEIQGQMATETVNNKRKLVILPKTIQTIPEPANPYDY